MSEPTNDNGNGNDVNYTPLARESHAVDALAVDDTQETDDDASADDIELNIPSLGRALTRCERALFTVLCDPRHFGTTGRDRAKAAGISESSYWKLMGKPDFHPAVAMGYRLAIRKELGPVIRAMLDTASTPGRDGAPDRSVALMIGGIHSPRQQVDISTAPRNIVGIVGLSLDEL